MTVDQIPLVDLTSVWELRAERSRCEIIYRVSDSDYDQLDVRCAGRVTHLDDITHRPSVLKIRTCRVIVMTNEVRFPRLLAIENCNGQLNVVDYGNIWTKNILKIKDIDRSSLDRVIFYEKSKKFGCYRVSVIFSPASVGASTFLLEKSRVFCLPKRFWRTNISHYISTEQHSR